MMRKPVGMKWHQPRQWNPQLCSRDAHVGWLQVRGQPEERRPMSLRHSAPKAGLRGLLADHDHACQVCAQPGHFQGKHRLGIIK
jgi:hypothetical protein